MPSVPVRASRRARAHVRRYLTVEQIMSGRGGGVGRGGLSDELIDRALVEGYAAKGPWEVERRGSYVTLLHYAFPIAKARVTDGVWRIESTQGRPGYGPSATDKAGVWQFASKLAGYDEARRAHALLGPTGLNPDARLRSKKHGGTYRGGGMGSRVSPYAVVDEGRLSSFGPTFGPSWTPYTQGQPFPSRRGRRVR